MKWLSLLFIISKGIYWTPSAYIHAFSHSHNYLYAVTYVLVNAIYWHACKAIVIKTFQPMWGCSTSCVCIITSHVLLKQPILIKNSWPVEWTGILNMTHYTDLGFAFLFSVMWCSSEVIWIMGSWEETSVVVKQTCHVLIRLQLQQAFSCIMKFQRSTHLLLTLYMKNIMIVCASIGGGGYIVIETCSGGVEKHVLKGVD